MLELVLLISILLVIVSTKVTSKYVTIIARITQSIIAVYCMNSGNLGYIGQVIGVSNSGILLYVVSMALISYELEVMQLKRLLKETLYLSSCFFILSSNINLILMMVLIIQFVFLYTRKSYFIDYVSLFTISLVSLIYFSELSSTVLTIRDSYYIFLTRGSELLFFPLILVFGLLEYIRLLGVKRKVSYLLALVPLVLLYKMKLSNNIDQELSLALLPFLIPCIIKISSKLMSLSSVKQNMNVLFLISIISSYSYALVERYELAITTVLILITLHLIYSISIYFKEKDDPIFKVITIFSLSNIACIPLGFFGFLVLDLLSTISSFIGFLSIFIYSFLSIVILSFTVKIKNNEIFFNILETSPKAKVVALLGVLLTTVIIMLNLSSNVVSINSSQKMMGFLFDLEAKRIPSGMLSYNVNFILFLVILVLIGYVVRTISKEHFWRIGKKIEIFMVDISSSKINFKKVDENRRLKENTERLLLSDQGQVSSYTVSFIILSLFLVISLAIIEF